MRTPDRHTTETNKRPASQIAAQLGRAPLKPHQAKASYKSRHTIVKRPAKGPAVTVEPGPTVLQRIINAV
jgi:hypothetical protein